MKKSFSYLTAGSLAICLAMNGGVAQATVTESPQPIHNLAGSSSSSTQGIDLFKAIYFGVGPKVKEVSDALNDPAYDAFVAALTQSGDQTQAAELMVKAINKKDPKFFSTFNRQMTSGDVFDVEASMRSAQLMVDQVVKDQMQQSSRNGRQSTTSRSAPAVPSAAAPIFVWAAAVWDAAAAVNYGVVVNVGAAVNAYAAVYAKTKFWPKSASQSSTLDAENNVASYTKSLSEMR